MSAATLESLLADFEKRCRQPHTVEILGRTHMIDFTEVSQDFTPDHFEQMHLFGYALTDPIYFDSVLPEVALAAGAYIIARDFDLEAAMMFKLSNGAIDPRE